MFDFSAVKSWFQTNTNLKICILIFIFWLSLFTLTGTLFSGSHLINDHEIVAINRDLSKSSFSFLEVIFKWLIYDRDHSRFRPFYYIHRVFKTQVFELNFVFWYAYNICLASITTFSLFYFGRLVQLTIREATIFAALPMLGSASVVWWRLGTHESIGIPLVAIALVFTGLAAKSKSHTLSFDLLLILFTVLASLTKEGLVLWIPAACSLRVLLYAEFHNCSAIAALSKSLFPVSVLLSSFGAEMIYIVWGIGTGGTGYAGVDESNFSLPRLFSTVQELIRFGHLLIPVFILVVVLILRRTQPDRFRKIGAIALLFLIATLPQILLYAKSGMSAHYLLPAIIPCSFLVAHSLSLLENYPKIIRYFFLAILVFVLIQDTSYTWRKISAFASAGRTTNQLLQRVESCTSESQAILIAANPIAHYEVSHSLKRYLSDAIQRPNLWLATYGTQETHFYSNTFAKVEQDLSFLRPQAVKQFYDRQTIDRLPNKNEIQAILVLDSDKLVQEFIRSSRDWFDVEQYDAANFAIDDRNTFKMSIALYCKRTH